MTFVHGSGHVDWLRRRVEALKHLPTFAPTEFSEDYDTIGGFICVKLGRMPKSGDQVRFQLARITATEVSRRRVERVRIEILPETQRESA